MIASQIINDVCYVKTSDGTSCLLLSIPGNRNVQSVEIVGSKMHWLLDKQQIGGSFLPWSICTDGSTVFVANLDPAVLLHLLSVEDGSVLTSISLRPFGFRILSCVRLQGEHLFLGHKNEERAYCISKFTKLV